MKQIRHLTQEIFWIELLIHFIILYFMLVTTIEVQIILFTIAVILIVRVFDIYKPDCWFTIPYYLYSISYPLLYSLNLLAIQYACSPFLLPMEYFALLAFLVGNKIPLIRIGEKRSFGLGKYSLLRNKEAVRLLIVAGMLVLVVAVILILTSEFSNKESLYSSSNLVIQFAMRYCYLQIIFSFYWVCSTKRFNTQVIISIIVIAFLGLVSGERDITFIILLMTISLLFEMRKIKRIHIFTLLPIAFLLVPISAAFKYYFMANESNKLIIMQSVHGFLYSFFYSEFIAASRNLELVIENIDKFDFHWYSLFTSILARFGLEFDTPITIFNYMIYGNSKVGHGFTIVGEGYFYGKWIGVGILMFLTGYLAKVLYRSAEINAFCKTVYLYMIPLFIYSSRMEFSAFFSPLCKHIALSYIIISLLNVKRRVGKNHG